MTRSGKPLRYISAQWISTGTERKVSYESFRRKGHEGHFSHCGLCIGSRSISYLCVSFANGLPAMGKIGPLKFLFGTEWRPTNDKFGILPMIVASIYVTAGAILIGVPIALFTSVFMARYCPKKFINH